MAHDEKLQAALDGALSDREVVRLSKTLDSDPVANRGFEALRRVDGALRKLVVLEPPADLRHGVMRQIRLTQAMSCAPGRKSAGFWQGWWKARYNARPAFQMGLGFALGVLVVTPLLWPLSDRSVDPAAVSGTLISRQGQSQGSRGELKILGPGFSGSLFAQTKGEVLTVEIHLQSPDPIEARLDFETPVKGLIAIGSTGSPIAGRLGYSGRRLTLAHQGRSSYSLSFSTEAGVKPQMHLSVVQDGKIGFQADVP